ncbi:hypothetical protein [Mycolicibacterium sp. lyk4-40-TYG-92]|uniref:hypothetical protein n=1 Tax=Mycolicibacterium sp. lyk4-40-TYG-92 TaxID=3040295 RepID=UPI00254B8EBC|nr:hypothetical protein [Mycolicibacterium sp. lyk4-40-TYG-92]
MGAASDDAVTAAVLVVTFVLAAAALDVVCAGVIEAVSAVSARVGLATDLVLALDLDDDLAPVLGLAGPDATLPLSCVSPFGVVDEPPVWAPPLLLTTTPEPTSALEEVGPEVGDVPDMPDTEDEPVAPEPPVVPVVPVIPAVPEAPALAADPDVAPPAAPEAVDPLDELGELADPPTVSATATP